MILVQAAIWASAGVFSEVQTRPIFSALDDGFRLPSRPIVAASASIENRRMMSSCLSPWCAPNPCRFNCLAEGTAPMRWYPLRGGGPLRSDGLAGTKKIEGAHHDPTGLHPHSRRRAAPADPPHHS